MVKRSNNNQPKKVISAKGIMTKYSLSYQAVNHYTDLGLLPVLLKKGNRRLYDEGVVGARLSKMRELMEEGYSLRLIRKKLIGI